MHKEIFIKDYNEKNLNIMKQYNKVIDDKIN